jgi:hypothetical protein
MKKFTSLFALLASLCVVSAQADPFTIYFYSSNPASQVCYWFWYENNVKHESNWNTSISSNSDIVPLGNNFFKKEFANDYNSTLKIIFHDEYQGNETQQIALQEGDNYFYYFGNKYYLTSDALKIAGPFTDWQIDPQKFTINSLSTWTYDWIPSEDAVPFKIIAKRIKDDWTGVEDRWLGYSDSNLESNNTNPFITVNAPQGWLKKGDDGNFVLNHASTGYQQYRLAATWNPNSNFAWGWNLKIEGVGSLDLDLDDNTPFLGDGVATSATSATYSRECTNQWGTLCLPFEFNADQSGVTFYEMTDVTTGENGAITFTPIYGDIEAGQPVAFKLEDDPRDFEGASCYLNVESSDENGVDVVTEAGTFGDVNGWSMLGTFKNTTLDNVYVIQANEIHPTGTGLSIKPYRAWFTSNSNSQAPLRIEVADTEGLQFIEQEDGTVKAYYDLQGRKLDSARKGLVIENGKIIMVK